MFLGIDIGHTTIKAVLFDLQGNELAKAGERIPTIAPKPGYYETPTEDLWVQTAKVLNSITGRIDPTSVESIGLSGGGNGFYPLDERFQPVCRGIPVLDRRATHIIDELKAEGAYDGLFKKLGMPVLSGCVPVLLRWFKENRRSEYDRIKHILSRKDVVRYRMTGDVSTDISDACFGTLNVQTQEYDNEILEILGVNEMADTLPELRPNSYDIAGYVTAQAAQRTGLREGTPVVAGAHDAACDTVGAGAIRDNIECTGGGTWSINLLTVDRPTLSPSWSCESFVKKGTWVLEQSSPTATVSLDWFVQHFCSDEREKAKKEGKSVYQECDAKVANVETSIIYLPFLMGLPWGYPFPSDASAAFLGVRIEDTRWEILRALYEGVSFIHALHIEKYDKEVGVSEVRFTGGAANSPLWCQMLADVLGKKVVTVGVKETGCYGAALLSALGTGHIKSLEDTAAHVRTGRVYEYQKQHSYSKKYETFKESCDALGKVWTELERLRARTVSPEREVVA
jgi:L-xylulokinase